MACQNVQVKFLSLSSGSSGNCYFLGRFDADSCLGGLLIDAGVSLKRLKSVLADHGLSTDDIGAVLITHDHMDHVRSLASYCKRLRKPVWSSDVLIDSLMNRSLKLAVPGATGHKLNAGEWNVVCGFHVRYFIVPHDATQTVGFAVRIPLGTVDSDASPRNLNVGNLSDGNPAGHDGEKYHRFFIMTDAGRVTDESVELAGKADTVVFESNYDVDMLMAGPYTHDLKMRIMNGHGHLSNDECADALRRFCHPGLRNVFLCHLSENNNTPRLAYDASAAVLRELQLCGDGVAASGQVSLRPLPRTSPSGLILL